MDALATERAPCVKGGSRSGFTAVFALLFLAAAAVTIERCTSVAAMGATPMAGGESLSMAWMRMCGQSWTSAAVSFLGMWMAMTVAMMLPVLAPSLWRLQQGCGEASPTGGAGLVALAAAAYFLVWGVLGLAVYPIGAACAALASQMQAKTNLVPLASAVVLTGAGLLQLSGWKRGLLANCRDRCPEVEPTVAPARRAWRHGLHLGLHCNACCAPMTLALLVLGVMDLHTMTAATVAIAAERLAPCGLQIARVSGVLTLAAGLALGWSAVGG